MIALVLSIAAQAANPAAAPSLAEIRSEECLELALDDPASGVAAANAWHIEGGGYRARHCLGIAYAKQFRWEAAARAFVEAAEGAARMRDPRAASFWIQAGNAALAGNRPAAALDHFNAALVQGTLERPAEAALYLDRARALVALGRSGEAADDLARVRELAPEDPLGWLLSATLARRLGDVEGARRDIAVAARLAPSDPAVALEAGNIAISAGDAAAARRYWRQAIELDTESLPAMAAKRQLDELGELAGEHAAETAPQPR